MLPMNPHREIFASRPSTLRFMPKALWPSRGWRAERGCPDSQFIWRDYCISSQTIAKLQGFAGASDPAQRAALLLLAPHITGFRLTMAFLMHPRWPLAIWGALQFRNRLRLLGPLQLDQPSELSVKACAWRVHAKGLEVDLHSELQQHGAVVWESIVTIYYRGRFGAALEHGAARGAAASSPVLDPGSAPVAQWCIDTGRRFEFCRLTGDYNPLHLNSSYAHRMGFAGAFPHPQRVAAQCLGHLVTSGAAPRQLDLWIKGPALFGAAATLRQAPREDGGQDFALWVPGEQRPALVGSLYRELSVAAQPA
jgi:hypothetical protein